MWRRSVRFEHARIERSCIDRQKYVRFKIMVSGEKEVTSIDLSDPDHWHVAPPYREFERLRRTTPVAWNERHDGHRGFWAVTSHSDVVTVSRDTATFSSEMA